MRRISVLFAIVMLCSLAALANIAPAKMPKQKAAKSVESTLTIRLDPAATEARLLIPKSELKQLRAELELLDDEPDTAAVAGISRTQTIVSGILLSMAFMLGGVWFTRKTNAVSGKTIAAGSILFAAGAMATMVFANAGPPPETRSITGQLFGQTMKSWGWASGRIKIETSATSNGVELIVPNPKQEQKPGGE